MKLKNIEDIYNLYLLNLIIHIFLFLYPAGNTKKKNLLLVFIWPGIFYFNVKVVSMQ